MPQSDNLQSISTRIRALLAKAADAGVTEAEALLFAAKARELMERYQLSLSDLELREEGTTRVSSQVRDPDIGLLMVGAIAHFCDCKGWSNTRAGTCVFFGLRSDADLASWLWVALRSFVEIETLDWSLSNGGTRQDVVDFSHACAKRIAERLREARPTTTSEGRALLVLKDQIVTQEFAKLGLQLRRKSVGQTGDSLAAREGREAGDRAAFGRPLSGRVAGLLAQGGQK